MPGRLCHILSFVVDKCFWHFARPAIFDSQLLRPESRFLPIFHLHSTPPLGGFSSEYRHTVWYGITRMVWLHDGEKISKICLFVLTWCTNVTDRHRMTAIAALMHSIARQKDYSTFCTVEANCWETWSIAQPLCDSRATCFSFRAMTLSPLQRVWK